MRTVKEMHAPVVFLALLQGLGIHVWAIWAEEILQRPAVGQTQAAARAKSCDRYEGIANRANILHFLASFAKPPGRWPHMI